MPSSALFSLEDDRHGQRHGVDATAIELQWVARIRAGDRDAFEQLVRAYAEPLQAFLLTYVKRPAVAEDLLQDVFLTLWHRRDRWNVTTSLRSYLYAASRNAALLERRHMLVVEKHEAAAVRNDEAPAMGIGTGPADARAEHALAMAAVHRSLAKLPERCRQAAILRLQHNLSPAEAAEVMGVSLKAVSRLYARALKVLRVDLAESIGRRL
jgi:RNA polymerase sigma-70 factor, ECF subfamily